MSVYAPDLPRVPPVPFIVAVMVGSWPMTVYLMGMLSSRQGPRDDPAADVFLAAFPPVAAAIPLAGSLLSLEIGRPTMPMALVGCAVYALCWLPAARFEAVDGNARPVLWVFLPLCTVARGTGAWFAHVRNVRLHGRALAAQLWGYLAARPWKTAAVLGAGIAGLALWSGWSSLPPSVQHAVRALTVCVLVGLLAVLVWSLRRDWIPIVGPLRARVADARDLRRLGRRDAELDVGQLLDVLAALRTGWGMRSCLAVATGRRWVMASSAAEDQIVSVVHALSHRAPTADAGCDNIEAIAYLAAMPALDRDEVVDMFCQLLEQLQAANTRAGDEAPRT